MAQRIDDVIRLCCKIAEGSGFKNTWEKAIEGMWTAGLGALAGGLLFGPPGVFFGASVGGLLSWWQTSGQFKSVPQILMELPDAEKQELYDAVVAVLDNLTWTDARQLIAIVMDDAALQQKVTAVLIDYIKKNV
ncbi:protein C19orf12 homolog [Pagrus major]|uniref:protein C19orf12 homolog n=1 Tax=Pagrus major TaxID=143350 RepID=UPI003CC862EC